MEKVEIIEIAEHLAENMRSYLALTAEEAEIVAPIWSILSFKDAQLNDTTTPVVHVLAHPHFLTASKDEQAEQVAHAAKSLKAFGIIMGCETYIVTFGPEDKPDVENIGHVKDMPGAEEKLFVSVETYDGISHWTACISPANGSHRKIGPWEKSEVKHAEGRFSGLLPPRPEEVRN